MDIPRQGVGAARSVAFPTPEGGGAGGTPRGKKVVHFVRHAQGFHNVAGNADFEAFKSWDYADARLTPEGQDQVRRLREELAAFPADLQPEVVMVSPMSRTIETALGLFGAEGDDDDGGLAKRWPAPSRAVPPPLVAHEDLRETLHTHPCDWRSPVATLRERYPSVDYSLVETNEDTWYVHDHPRETDAQIQARATRFFAHLAERPESRVAVVSHYGWLVNGALAAMGLTEAAHGPDGSTMYKNCELRTFVLEPSTEEK